MQALHAAWPIDSAQDERVEDELREFSYIVSHDLATEFRHVAEFSKILIKALETPEDGSWRTSASIISLSSRKCQTMLDGLLAFSRAQQSEFNAVECNLSRVVEVALLRILEDVRKAGASVDLNVAASVRGDASLLANALEHVLRNALQFPHPERTLAISITSFSRPGGDTVVRVSDNGVGLEEAYWEKAFRMFWRLDPRANADGCGAGLPIARRILRRHGGDLRFVPQDAGACLEISLPTSRRLH